MKLFGFEITRDVEKKIPAGGVHAGDRSEEANRLSGRTPVADSAAPAAGPRPHPGPLPAPGDGAPAPDLRHAPIRWNIPHAANQTWTPRSRALTPFALLRQLAEVSSEVRTCIETRKDQMTSLAWDITPRDKKQKSDALAGKLAEVRTFFRRPDKRRDFSTWLRMAIEDVLVVDALSIYRRKTRGGALFALELKDGATFLPLLDEDGDTPLAPRVAYRQIINGMPMVGGDCSVDELYYRPRTVRTHTPYGLSPTEAVLLCINAALNRQVFNLQYYTEGNVPEGLLEGPEGFTATQLTEFQEYMDDYLVGNLGARRRMKVVAHGIKAHQFKDPDFTSTYDEWLLKVICASFAVPPQELGFTGDVNKATGQMQENVSYRRGVKPLGTFFKSIFDDVLTFDLGLPELEWVWTGGEVEDKLVQAQADKIYVGMGKIGVDELRARDGQEPIGLGPYIETAMGPVFVEELLTEEPDDDPNTSEVGNPTQPAAAMKPAEGAPAGSTAAPSETGEAAIPQTSLNGAQVKSLLEILTLVASGQLPREAGVRAIMVAFNLAEDVAEGLMGEIGNGFEPAAPTASPAAPPAAAAKDTDEDAKVSEAAMADLRKWRAIAINCVKASKPLREFTSDEIPFELHARVERFVSLAASTGDVGKVVAAFELAIADYQVTKAGESRKMTRAEQRAAKAYKKVIAKHFSAQGKALAAHVKKGLS